MVGHGGVTRPSCPWEIFLLLFTNPLGISESRKLVFLEHKTLFSFSLEHSLDIRRNLLVVSVVGEFCGRRE